MQAARLRAESQGRKAKVRVNEMNDIIYEDGFVAGGIRRDMRGAGDPAVLYSSLIGRGSFADLDCFLI
jgi:hypothetical protein